MKNFRSPKGTRDFSPNEIKKRNFINKIIKNILYKFGYLPIETPAFEMTSTLSGKYGEEGDNLMFRIFVNNISKKIKETLPYIKNTNHEIQHFFELISNKTLRYDLTVPFVRYISTYKNIINFPFKRYQIQPVWRAENSQKNRWREFYQFDADIASKNPSLWEEIELIQICDKIFEKLNFSVKIYINHIHILKSITQLCDIDQNLWKDFFVSLDKWKKIGQKKVKEIMLKKGISLKSFNQVKNFIKINNNFFKSENILIDKFKLSKYGLSGIKDIFFIYNIIKKIRLKKTKLIFDLSLARGMNYYTGIIWEIVPNENKKCSYTHSIGGGGRYNKLFNMFGEDKISGVGISLGIDRIYVLMEKYKLFNKNSFTDISTVLFINFGNKESLYSYKIINILRNNNISTYLYPSPIKISKQFKYANDNNIPFVMIIGKNEIKNKIFILKDIKNKIEKKYKNIEEIITKLKI